MSYDGYGVENAAECDDIVTMIESSPETTNEMMAVNDDSSEDDSVNTEDESMNEKTGFFDIVVSHINCEQIFSFILFVYCMTSLLSVTITW